MKRTHTATLYRRTGSVTEDSRGREVKVWAAYATNLPCNLQMLSGSVEFLAAGRDKEGVALLLFEPGLLAVGTEARASDGVVITSGRTPFPWFVVSDAAPIGERGEGWDDELVLTDTEEAIP